MLFRISHLPIVDSTNSYLKSLVDAPEGTCITADQQTAGRGRQNRNWHSAAGEGLYLSLLLRPTTGLTSLPLLSLTAAIAVAETFQSLGFDEIDIKWPNDLLCGERKICGILVEATGLHPQESPRVIVGIGVNLNQRSFPPPLDETATSLLIERGEGMPIVQFRDLLLDRFSGWYARWYAQCYDSGQDDRREGILSRWMALSSYGWGREVIVKLESESLTGITEGLNHDGALLVRTADGTLRTVLAGEVTRLRPIEPVK
jgi:BirA family transcriptional regulator, biotin operon repressor / biotin---[acetyl-CoA-carboxylase] ligase